MILQSFSGGFGEEKHNWKAILLPVLGTYFGTGGTMLWGCPVFFCWLHRNLTFRGVKLGRGNPDQTEWKEPCWEIDPLIRLHFESCFLGRQRARNGEFDLWELSQTVPCGISHGKSSQNQGNPPPALLRGWAVQDRGNPMEVKQSWRTARTPQREAWGAQFSAG